MKTGDLPGAVAAWHAANIARGKPPTPQRVTLNIARLEARISRTDCWRRWWQLSAQPTARKAASVVTD